MCLLPLFAALTFFFIIKANSTNFSQMFVQRARENEEKERKIMRSLPWNFVLEEKKQGKKTTKIVYMVARCIYHDLVFLDFV